MINGDTPPDTRTFTSICFGWSVRRKPRKVVEFFNRMLDYGCKPDMYTFKACRFVKEEVEEIWRKRKHEPQFKHRRQRKKHAPCKKSNWNNHVAVPQNKFSKNSSRGKVCYAFRIKQASESQLKEQTTTNKKMHKPTNTNKGIL